MHCCWTERKWPSENEWVDEYGDTYVIYPKQEMKKYLNISRYRIDQALAELEEHDQMVEVTVPYPGKAIPKGERL